MRGNALSSAKLINAGHTADPADESHLILAGKAKRPRRLDQGLFHQMSARSRVHSADLTECLLMTQSGQRTVHDRRETGPFSVENSDWATYLETSG